MLASKDAPSLPFDRIEARPKRRAFCPADLLPARALLRTVSTVRIDPEHRRAILYAASRGALPRAWLEIVGLAVPAEGLVLDLSLHRGAASPCLMLGQLRVGAAQAPRRCSRQLPMTPKHVAQLAAASQARIMTLQSDVEGRLVPVDGLPCLGLSLVFETSLPPAP